MFYSDTILSKKGPLAKVWLAAHWERKLSKTQFLQTDITSSVGAIMGQDQAPMALRLSGQLLLGIVRIYSRKARYLLEDCNEALLKLKMAFRPGVVDMSDDQMKASSNLITLQDNLTELDMMLPDPFLSKPFGFGSSNANVSRPQDITLDDHYKDMSYIEEFDPSFVTMEYGRGIDGYPSELGLNGDGVIPSGEASMDIEVGRDAVRERSLSLGAFGGRESSLIHNSIRGSSIGIEQGMNATFIDDGGDLGLGLDLGIPIDDNEPNFGSPLRAEAEAGVSNILDDSLDPFEFNEINFEQEMDENVQTGMAIKSFRRNNESARKRRIIVDSITEIPARQIQQQTKDTSDIIVEPSTLASSRTAMMLNQIQSAGVKYFMLDEDEPPHGMTAKGIAELYKNIKKRSYEEEMEEIRAGKMPRTDNPSSPLADDVNRTIQMEHGEFDDAPIILGDELDISGIMENNVQEYKEYMEETIQEPSSGVIEFMNEHEEVVENLQTESPVLLSNNTVSIAHVLRKEFNNQWRNTEASAEEGCVTFKKLMNSTNKKKSEASKMFFELLLLGTKDAISLKQSESYGEIYVKGKESLFDLEALPGPITVTVGR